MSVPSEIFRCEEEILHEKYCFGNKQTKNKIENLEGLYHECVQQCIHLSTNAFCNSGYFLQTSAMLMMVHCVIYLHYCCIVPWKINFHSCSYDMEYGYHQNTVLDYLPGHTHRAESNIQCFAILTSICISLCIYNGYVFNRYVSTIYIICFVDSYRVSQNIGPILFFVIFGFWIFNMWEPGSPHFRVSP